jgi:hypothetical protein
MLDNPKLRKVASLSTAAIGLATLVSPKRAAIVGDKLNLATRYENVSDADLAPRDWYVDATRASGAGMVAAGLTGFLLATRDDVPTDDEPAVDADVDEDADAEDAVDVVETASDDADDGPVEIDLDDADDPDDD